ncbi:brassinosteroid LRR receptor kinase precursor [Pelomyxa schiedti]|nr:brassinosteroid LRR receptor kinase precursor [Pelomyxa schiedti]
MGSSLTSSSSSLSSTSESISETERELLRAEAEAVCDLYTELKPASWKDPCEEYTEEPPCNETAFEGLQCLDGHISSVYLMGDATRQGTIPPTIGNFLQLATLDLSRNKIAGTIPETLSRLRELVTISLWNNSLTGEIPCLQNLTSLILIDLDSNLLTGALPTWIVEFADLFQLRINMNHLSGVVPPLPHSLQILTLAENTFSGTLDVFSNLTLLVHLDLCGNQFRGSIPIHSKFWTYISNAQKAVITKSTHRSPSIKITLWKQTFYTKFGPEPVVWHSSKLLAFHDTCQLFSNQLSGELPATLFSTAVKKLLLQNNFFNGTLPIFKAPKLLNLDLSSNMISGPITQAFWLSAPKLNSL